MGAISDLVGRTVQREKTMLDSQAERIDGLRWVPERGESDPP